MKNYIIILLLFAHGAFAESNLRAYKGLYYVTSDRPIATAQDVANISDDELRGLYNLAAFSDDAIAALGPRLSLVRPDALLLLRGGQINSLTDAALGSLTAQQVGVINKHGARLGADKIAKLSSAAREAAQTAGTTTAPLATATPAPATPTPVVQTPVPAVPTVGEAQPAETVVQQAPVIPNPTPAPAATVTTTSQAQLDAISKASQEGLEGFNPDSCVWSNDLPRRIGTGPNMCREQAGSRKVEICSGYVVCDTKSEPAVKFVRAVACSRDKCEEGDAVECAKDSSHKSYVMDIIPGAMDGGDLPQSTHVTEPLRGILTTPTQAPATPAAP